MNLYDVKQEKYFNKVRYDLISLIPKNINIKVLEIGSGAGDTLVYLKTQNIAQEVVGVDIFELPGTNQKHHSIDKFLIKDIEREDLDLPYSYYDVILLGDVLEHLVDPWSVLQKLQCYLKVGGRIIVSVPNIRYYKVLKNVFFEGDFKYDPEGGILDKTHLRFFCKKNLKALISLSNFHVDVILPIQSFPGHPMSWKVSLFNFLTLNYFEDFFASQFIGVAVKNNEG